MSNNFIAYKGASYIKDFTVLVLIKSFCALAMVGLSACVYSISVGHIILVKWRSCVFILNDSVRANTGNNT